MLALVKRILVAVFILPVPGRWRGHLLARFGVIRACGKGGLFCTRQIGTEPYLISLGEETVVASDTMFVTHDMSVTVAARALGRGDHLLPVGEIRIGSYCFIGARSILLPGVSICDRVVVGAGSLVKDSITEPGVYVGIGPRKVGELEDLVDGFLRRDPAEQAALAARYPDQLYLEDGILYKFEDRPRKPAR